MTRLGTLLLQQPLALGLGALGLAMAWRQPGRAPWRRRMALLAATGVAVASGRLAQTLLLVLAAAGTARAVPVWRAVTHRDRESRLVAAALAGLFLLTVREAVPPRSDGEGARLLASDVASLCAWEGTDARDCPLQVIGDPWAEPLLAWHLRDLGGLRWVSAPRPEPGDRGPRPLVIAPGAAAGAVRLEGYAASPYRLGSAEAGRAGVVLWVPRDAGGAGGVRGAARADRPPRSAGGAW